MLCKLNFEYMRWREALNLFYDMEKSKVKMDLYTFNTVISALDKGRQWEKALEVFRKIDRYHLKPNVISFNSTLSACAKGSQ